MNQRDDILDDFACQWIMAQDLLNSIMANSRTAQDDYHAPWGGRFANSALLNVTEMGNC